MRHLRFFWSWRRLGTALPLAVLLAAGPGCGSIPQHGDMANDLEALRRRLLDLGPDVLAAEAGKLADSAVSHAAYLAQDFRVVRPPGWHNYLVNYGVKDAGLCYQWANALFLHLHELGLQSLELHLAVARMDTSREHNCVVVTAAGQPFRTGVVLDAWRGSGRVFSGPVATDKYPWHPLPEDRFAPEIAERLGR